MITLIFIGYSPVLTSILNHTLTLMTIYAYILFVGERLKPCVAIEQQFEMIWYVGNMLVGGDLVKE